MLEGAIELFTRGKKTKEKYEGHTQKVHLFWQFGWLQMELEWLKNSLSCSDAHELRNLVDYDHPELSVGRQCCLLGLPRSTFYDRPTPVRESSQRIMGKIDSLYLEDLCSCTRRMIDYLA